ncbi:helix-turn-helix domain-containing protein [Saccharothrix stipae]
MRTTLRVATGTGFAVDDLRIVARTPVWWPPEAVSEHRVVFVRRGLFRVRLPGWTGLVDPLVAYVRPAGAEHAIAHRPDAADACTVISLDGALADQALPGGPTARPLMTSAAVDLAHRTLLARARQGADEFELTERVLTLADRLFGLPRPPRGGLPSHRRLADAARARLAADPAGPTFGALAAELGVSRPHLSRVFRAVTGTTLTAFRTGVRVRAALDAIDEGRTNLADLAADLGFADHAHLTRTLRAELGSPPGRVRAVLRGW